MALYLGSSTKLKIIQNRLKIKVNMPSTTPVVNGVKLLSFDNLILKDSNGLYLTAKKGE